MCYGYSASFTERYLTGVHPLATATGSQVGATLGLAIPTLWFWPEHNPGPGPWMSMLVLGVVCTALAYILYFRLIAHAGPSRALAVTFIAPVFAVFYGALFLDETVTPWMLGCALVIVCGTMLSTGLIRTRDAPKAPSKRA